MPYGVPPRPNRACPNCGALQRHRVLALYLRRELPLTAEQRVLHIAPEKAIRPLVERSPHAVYATVDLQAPSAAIRAELAHLPFRDAQFDVVICSHVLEHIEHDIECMVELRRVLAGDGRALVMVPVDRKRLVTYEDPTIVTPEARLREYGHREHVRYYAPDVVDRLRTAGFDVEEVDITDRLTVADAERAVVGKGESIYVCGR
jgi:SAM-dependent methyltransferase